MASKLNEFIAGLTWPLRGRKAMLNVETQIRQELDAVWRNMEQIRHDVSHIRAEIGHVRHDQQRLKDEMDAVRQTVENGLRASEKLMRGNLSHFHDRIENLQQSDGALRHNISAVLNQIDKLKNADGAS